MSAEIFASELTVAILPMGNVSPTQIEFTALVLELEFGVKTIVLPGIELPIQHLNVERGLYQGLNILAILFSKLPAYAQRIMGVVEGELERDENTPCVGCAHPYNRVAAYSSAPISEWNRLGITNKEAKLYCSYFVIAHEFGHTLGLPHCADEYCLMHKSPSSAEMCPSCCRWVHYELKTKPGSAKDWFSLAESLFFYGRHHEAVTAYGQAILQNPYEPLYHNHLAVALIKIGGNKQRLTHEVATAAMLARDNKDALYNFGVTFLKYNLNRSEEYFAKAIATAGDPKHINLIIGTAYREALHEVERASRHYLEYLRLGGDDQDVVDWLVSRSKLEKK